MAGLLLNTFAEFGMALNMEAVDTSRATPAQSRIADGATILRVTDPVINYR